MGIPSKNDTTLEEGVIKKSISLPQSLFDRALDKARFESRDFSKHVKHLLRMDLGDYDQPPEEAEHEQFS